MAKIRQEVSILDSLYESLANTDLECGEKIYLDSKPYNPIYWDGETVYFEVFAYNSDNQARSVRLTNYDFELEVSVSVPNNSTWTRVRSASFSRSFEQIKRVILDGTTSAGQLKVKAARVVIIQDNFTKTFTQIEIGNKETGKNNTANLPLNYPKYWKYEANKWGDNCAFYFCISARVSTNQTLEYITATLQKDDGNFDNWTDVISILFYAQASHIACSDEFSPTDGCNYRIVTKISKQNVSYDINNAKILVNQANSVKKLQPQYLIVNTNEGSIGLKRYDTYYDPADWSGVKKDFYHEINSSIDTTDSAKLQKDPGGTPVDIPNSTATGAKRARSSAMTMPDSAQVIGTNILNEPIYASRIIVDISIVSVILPGGIGSLEVFGSPTVQVLNLKIIPSGINSVEAFGGPTVVGGALTIITSGIGSQESFGSPQLNLKIVGSGISSQEVFGTPVLTDSQFVDPSAISSVETFGSPTVQPGVVAISPVAISSVEIFGYVKLVLIIPQQPVVKGKSPRPGETVVLRNKKVCFNICGGGLGSDGVDISTVKVKINGVEYDYVDPEFSYSGNPAEYYIEVSHPDFSYEQTVNIDINAESLANAVMETVQYGFFVEWESSLTRSGFAKIELYEPNKYDADALTIEEDWVRHGVERYTMELELWYGRYQKLPFVENLEFRILAGTTNALGKEILENGWLSVKVDGGIWIALYPSTVVDFGPMFTHSKKSLFFKLLVPETAVTTKYFLLSLLFELEMFFPYGRFMFSEGIYSDSGNLIEVHPDKRVYRAYVLSNAMWNALALLGFSPSPPLRGDDKQW